ncbi:SDR family NAD(P)-dependent oxidoreductase [Streptomyces sp. KL116D]|uniref:SDR family NAD(P)-dependent oxidoreductase n=1 Tax=Streptomyces sp. KL116D TaxID=3045152 RepID=UPI00355825A4
MSQPASTTNRAYLITGGNAGIGYFTAEQLAGTGATVVLGSRSPRAGRSRPRRDPRARARSSGAVGASRPRRPRLRLQATAEALEVEHLDAVVHNAGVLLEEPERTETGTAARPISASTTSGTSR